jgi:hypothetical protein
MGGHEKPPLDLRLKLKLTSSVRGRAPLPKWVNRAVFGSFGGDLLIPRQQALEQALWDPQLRAISGLMHRNTGSFFDHLVGAGEQGGRHDDGPAVYFKLHGSAAKSNLACL